MERQTEREMMIEAFMKLLRSEANDAVKLMVTDENDILPILGGLDLSAVTELKHSSNGTFEVKFINRLETLKTVYELITMNDGEGDGAARMLITAMRDCAVKSGCDETL